MRAGLLTETIAFERATIVPDVAGVPVETWATLATVRAELAEYLTEERAADPGTVTVRKAVFRTWPYDGLTLADRILFDGGAYNIKALKDAARGGLEIHAEAVGP